MCWLCWICSPERETDSRQMRRLPDRVGSCVSRFSRAAGVCISSGEAAAVVRCANASSTGDAETHDDLCVKLIKNADEPERKVTPLIKPGVSHRCALVLFWKVWLTAPRLLRLTWQRSHRTMVPRPTHCYIIAAFSTVRWRDLDSNIK